MRHFGGPTNWRRFAAVYPARVKRNREKFLHKLHIYQRKMVKNPTPIESKLYAILFGLKIPYNAQDIIGDFIVDASIRGHGIKKIIEADGFYHENYQQRKKDARRDKRLKELGYDVLHLRRHEFYNEEHLMERINDFVFDQDLLQGPEQNSSESHGSQHETVGTISDSSSCSQLQPSFKENV